MDDFWICPDDRFPILGTAQRVGGPALTVPMDFVAGYEKQAKANHGQTINRLKERGGLAWAELEAVLAGRSYHRMGLDDAHERVMRRVCIWQDAKRRAEPASIGGGG